MRRAAVLCGAALFAAIACASASAAPLTVRASFDAPTVEFGATIRAYVVVLLDPAVVRAGSLDVVDDAGPLTPLSPERTTRSSERGTTVIELTRTYSCLTSACVSPKDDAAPSLPKVTATVVTRDGKTLHATATWPTLHVRGRVTKADLARNLPPFLADVTPSPPSYRLAPSTLAGLLDGLAAVLALGAAALAVHEGLRLARRRKRGPPPDELARALRLVREAESRPAPDRRRALGLAARVLGARGRPLSGTANDLAWAKPEPQRESLETFVADAERE